jgi:RHS repeat-associated protein
LLARSFGYPSIDGTWSTHDYYFADANGNTTYMTDASQTTVAQYRYDPFGNTISSSGSMPALNTYRFSSKEIHANSGMYYYLRRFWDPNLGRWINQDPIEEIGGINLYAFYKNNPITKIDRFGLCGKTCEQICADLNNLPHSDLFGPGHVICNGEEKCACYTPGSSFPPAGECPDFEKAVMDHEKRHFPQVHCPGSNPGHKFPDLPVWKPDISGELSECQERARSIFELREAGAHSSGRCQKAAKDLEEVLTVWVVAHCD